MVSQNTAMLYSESAVTQSDRHLPTYREDVGIRCIQNTSLFLELILEDGILHIQQTLKNRTMRIINV